MAIDFEELLKPVSDAAPGGEDLASAGNELFNLVGAFDAARAAGAKSGWGDIQGQATALLARSKDLRVALILLRTLARSHGLTGAAEGMTLIARMVTEYWDRNLFPFKEKSPEIIRTNVLLPLVSLDPSAGFVQDLRAAPVAPASKMGGVTVRDILISQGLLSAPAGTPVKGAQEIQDLLKRSQEEHKVVLDGAVKALEAVLVLRTALKDKTTSTFEFAPLIDALRPVVEVCSGLGGPPLPASLAKAPTEDALATTPAEGGSTPAAAPAARGGIQNEQDVHRILEEVCLFLESRQPSHPAPLLLRRAQRLLKKNFLEIIEDLAPSSLDTIRGLGGIKKQ